MNQKENPTEVKQLPQVHNLKLKHILIVYRLHLTHVDKKAYEHISVVLSRLLELSIAFTANVRLKLRNFQNEKFLIKTA